MLSPISLLRVEGAGPLSSRSSSSGDQCDVLFVVGSCIGLVGGKSGFLISAYQFQLSDRFSWSD